MIPLAQIPSMQPIVVHAGTDWPGIATLVAAVSALMVALGGIYRSVLAERNMLEATRASEQKAATDRAAVAEKVTVANKAVTEKVEDIHTIVNSQRSLMLEKQEALLKEIEGLKLALSVRQTRDEDVARAVAAVGAPKESHSGPGAAPETTTVVASGPVMASGPVTITPPPADEGGK